MDDHFYRDIILDHWKNPHHYGLVRKPTVSIKKNNPLCGDTIEMTARITDGRVSKIGFVSEGCAISKAAASILTDLVEGETIEKIQKVSPEEFLKELGITLTPSRMKCALLGYTSLKTALASEATQSVLTR